MADENKQDMEDQPQDESQAKEAPADQAPAADEDVIAYGEPPDNSGGKP